MSTKNIVLFGGTGAGKSSVVNLMAGQEKARASPDVGRCTLQWQEHLVTFDGFVYKVFDTVGLEEPQLGTKAYLDNIMDTYNLIRRLKNEGGIDLLLYCVRAGPVTSTLQTNYRLFYEWLCENKVPIVLVLTGLENEKNMEDWWTRNEHVFSKYEIHVDGHACITAANHLVWSHRRLYEESRSLVRHLVIQHTQGSGGAWNRSEGLLTRFIRKLRELLRGKPKTKDVIDVLTERCGMPLSAAKALVRKVV
jgi:tRNA U34 5-carboxymethylaminomethyl modifying GTPase MnmE/TrmE